MTVPVGNRGPIENCPRCGGRAHLDPTTQTMKCVGRISGWTEHPYGRRPVYGPSCGWQALYEAGCCGQGVERGE